MDRVVDENRLAEYCEPVKRIWEKVVKRAIVLVVFCAGMCLPIQQASAAIKFKRFAHCAEGVVTVHTCECHKVGSTHFHYCHKGYYCHTSDGTCRP